MLRARATFRPAVESLETREVPSGFPVQSFKLPEGTNFPGNLTVGSDRNVWYSCGLASKVGYITPTGESTVFDTSAVTSHGMDGMTLGPDKNIWFVELFDRKIGSITPTGHITQYTLKQHGAISITTGPDRNLWVTTFDNHVGRVTTHGSVKWFNHKGEFLHKIVKFKGSLFVQEDHKIGRVNLNGKFIGEFKVPHRGTIKDIAVGPDGNLWFTEKAGSKNFIGSMSAAGRFHEYQVSGKELGHLTAAGDGNLYVRQGDDLIGVRPNGVVFADQNLEFIAGDGSVVKGPDGNVWYAEGVLGKIGVAQVRG